MTGTRCYSDSNRELTVAVCISTYYRLNGRMPSIEELCSQLGSGYQGLAIKMMNSRTFVEACCA